MRSVHDIEGIGVGARINAKETKRRTNTGTQEEGKRGKPGTASFAVELLMLEKQKALLS